MSDDHARPIPQGRPSPRPTTTSTSSTPAPGATPDPRAGRPARRRHGPGARRVRRRAAGATTPAPAHGIRRARSAGRARCGRPAPARPAHAAPAPGGGRRGSGSWSPVLWPGSRSSSLTPVHAWSQVTRADTTPTGDRPADADGHLPARGLGQPRGPHRGGAQGPRCRRATPRPGAPTRSSSCTPRAAREAGAHLDPARRSFLPIPGERDNKVNAAFAIGGPKLLAATLEQATGLPIDGYVEIGLGGFAGVVDSLGGVEVCVKRDIKDAKAHIDLKKGCQILDGKNALGYVRARYSDPKGDLGRAERQRQFLGAVMKQAATPSTVLIPWRWWGFTHTAASSVVVGEDTSLLDSYRILSTMRKVSSTRPSASSCPCPRPTRRPAPAAR